jgi:hypothetical protein
VGRFVELGGVLADLNAAHDYCADTKIGWDTVRKSLTDRPKLVDRSTPPTLVFSSPLGFDDRK